MQEMTLWEGSTCPLCETKGINSKLKFFRLNLRVAALLCKHKQCPFPVSTNYPDTFVRVGRDGNIIPGSQSEKGWPKEEEDDSDDSPYISDGSEESVTFPDIIPEVKNLHKFSSENTNEKGASEVDAFDISSIDFETDDSMDTYKLRNEITSLEMEITKSVENMKSVPPHVNRQGSTVLDNTSGNCKISNSVAAKACINSDDYVCPDTHRELDINGSRCVKVNENGAESCNDGKSGNVILRVNDSFSSTSCSLEFTKMSEELTTCVEEAKIPLSNVCSSNHKHADVQNTSNRNCQGEGHSDNDSSCEGVKSINHRNCSDNNVEKQLDTLCLADTSNPEPKSPILISQDRKDIVGNNLSTTCELQTELVSSESVTIKNDDFEKEAHGNIEIVIIFDDNKSADCNDNNAEKQHDTVSVTSNSDLKAEPTVLNPLGEKNAAGIGFAENCELHAKLVSSESVTFKKSDDCGKEMCDSKKMANIIADHKNSGCSDSAEKQLATLSVIDISNSKPELPALLSPQSTKDSVGNGTPNRYGLLAELVNCESLTLKKEDDCEEICGDKEIVNTFVDHKNSDCSDNAENQLVDTSNSKAEPPVLSSPQSTKNTVGNSLPSKCELLAKLASSESVPFKRDDDCGKEMGGNKGVVHILDAHNSDCDDNAEKQFDTLSMADTSDPEPEPSFSISRSTENTVGNDLPIKQKLHAELASSESVSFKKGNECENKKCDNEESDIIFDDQENCEVYHIVPIDSDTSTNLFADSGRYEVINLDLGLCKNQKSSGAIAKRKTTKKLHRARSEKSSIACSNSENVTPIVKLKIVDENGLFVCTTNNGPASVPEVEKTNQLQEMSEINKGHSKNCVCFLCKDSSKEKGITSHLDRELADLFAEQHLIETHLTETDFPTEKEIMRDFVRYVSGSSSFQNTKLSPRKRKRRFHL